MSFITEGSTLRGFLLTVIVAWGAIIRPVIMEGNTLQSSGDRSTHGIAVIAMAVIGVPVALIGAALFLPVHFWLVRQAIRNPVPYVAWGMTLLLVLVLSIAKVSPKEPFLPEQLPRIVPTFLVVGALLGVTFWIGAVLGRPR